MGMNPDRLAAGIPHHPHCAVHKGVTFGCDSDCGRGPGGDDWLNVPPREFPPRVDIGQCRTSFRVETATGIDPPPGSEGLVPLPFDPVTHTEREAMIARLIAHHENAFAAVAMRQAKLLEGGGADLSVLDAMTSRMAHHAAVLAELRR